QRLNAALNRRQLLRKAEANVLPPQLRVVIKARPRHGGHGDLLDQVTRHRDVVLVWKGADAGHDVVGTRRRGRLEAALVEAGDYRVAAFDVVATHLYIKGRGKLQRRRDCHLERMRGSDRKEVVHLANAVAEDGRRDDPTHTPAG